MTSLHSTRSHSVEPPRDGRVVNAMTVDVEDYFQVSAFDRTIARSRWDDLPSRVVANTERLLAVLGEHDVRATFFVLGWVADRHPALVQLIADLGHEIASHGFGHRLVYEQTPRAFREDVRRAKDLLESRSGQRVEGYRAPSFSITEASLWALDILIEEGYRYDASIYPIRHDRYGIPSSPRHPYVLPTAGGGIVEVPGSTARLVGLNLPIGGGGYFRLLPYAWTRWGIRKVNSNERRPVVFYLHPWEIDPDQPRLHASWLSRFRHYRNLEHTESRLLRLIADFRFAPLRQVLAEAQLDVPAAEALPQAG